MLKHVCIDPFYWLLGLGIENEFVNCNESINLSFHENKCQWVFGDFIENKNEVFLWLYWEDQSG